MPTISSVRPHQRVWPKRLPHALSVPATSLWFNLEVSARRYPDKTAYLFFGQPLSFSALQAQAQAVAGWLQRVGVKAGDRVALYLQNCPQFVVAYYAILRANAVVVPVNPMNKMEELTYQLQDAQAQVVICAADLAATVQAAQSTLEPHERLRQVLVTHYSDAMPPVSAMDPAELAAEATDAWLRAEPALPAACLRWSEILDQAWPLGPHTAEADDLAMLQYTSGTTGHPKGCMHSHRSLMSNAVTGCWTQSTVASVGLGVVPFFHITGLVCFVLRAVFDATSTVILPRWDRELAGRLISRHQVTHWTCIPTMVIDLFGSPNYKDFGLGGLVHINGGGAAMPQAVAERLQQEFGLTFLEGYGLTETAAATHGNPPERAKLQCLGMPFFGVDSRVVDPNTLRELEPGEVGEIVSRGPMLFQGYWRNPEATAAAFIELEGQRFFRTGDLGHMDEEGYFFLTDRLKRMINSSGFKVWPAEVEALLFKHPAVHEACIISSQDAYRGESVKALVVLRSEARGQTTEQQIIDWSREHMAAYKVPRQVQFVESLPKSGSGKVMWRLLQERETAGT
ncbi:long-chain fatty acid--CoA ligase [Pseudomonas sp. TH05]|uniref:long-chain fatty acid--CoA ligase n=1 Tax=unclassified Pseudomonas TaxID=196821 RepID=UPI0019122007|nr:MULTISPECIES: long-chain fatty acid--CoA ligase [unclassified Pseudomonas]MBK5541687.1 long-chain fatty acid--CoA ligase [Pseudomonas sp. TH07]MBK5555183.1 long-chain fatty acid--CoA ligase [Pseudomonas sp. TH05]